MHFSKRHCQLTRYSSVCLCRWKWSWIKAKVSWSADRTRIFMMISAQSGKSVVWPKPGAVRPRETRSDRPKMRPGPAGLRRPRARRVSLQALSVCNWTDGTVRILHTGIAPYIVVPQMSSALGFTAFIRITLKKLITTVLT